MVFVGRPISEWVCSIFHHIPPWWVWLIHKQVNPFKSEILQHCMIQQLQLYSHVTARWKLHPIYAERNAKMQLTTLGCTGYAKTRKTARSYDKIDLNVPKLKSRYVLLICLHWALNSCVFASGCCLSIFISPLICLCWMNFDNDKIDWILAVQHSVLTWAGTLSSCKDSFLSNQDLYSNNISAIYCPRLRICR